ncbi:MAG: hypothetical protein WC825_09235 [Gallionellaceae bacterium]|jgi:hypothetical protein
MLEENVRHYGTFQLHGLDVWGELTLAGENTQLILRTEKKVVDPGTSEVIHGQLHDFTLVSCLQCVGGDMPTQAWNVDGKHTSSWNVFPHQVLVGHSHFNPSEDRIRKMWFSTGDIYQIFDDFDSFGTLVAPAEQLQSVLPQTIGKRQVPKGPKPRFVYFAGRSNLLEASLSFGKLEVQHWPMAQTDSHGARITTQMMVQVEFEAAVNLEECLSKVASIGQFLSLVAGRTQGIENVQFAIDGRDNKELPLSLYWSLGPQQASGQKLDIPSWTDMPLDGIRRAVEFRQVIERWFSTNQHAIARARLHLCREAGNRFDVDRLVAAANLFDHTNALAPTEVPPELAKVRDECLRALKELPLTDERDSAIMALSRIGTQTLMKKVLFRATVLRGHIRLEDMDKVLRQAILCRNYFVHGSDDKRFNYDVVKSYTPFLTETLEFVFAAAELIECGWGAREWQNRFHTGHHWFSRFISDYPQASQELLSDLDQAK